MTGRKIRWNHYTDRMGRTISVRAVRTPSGSWKEYWTSEQLMTADFSRDHDQDEEDTQEENLLVYRSASDGSGGFQSRRNRQRPRNAAKNNSNNYRKGTHRG